MGDLSKSSFEFGGFRLDIAERQLLRDSSPIPLAPRVFDVLAVLVEHNGHLVEKDELLRLVWDDAFVEEANVARIVHTLRRVLGEKSEKKFIETVAKRGYRFVAEVKKANGSVAGSAVALVDPPAEHDFSASAIDGEQLRGGNVLTSVSDLPSANPKSLEPNPYETKRAGVSRKTFVIFGLLAFFCLSAAGFLLSRSYTAADAKPESKLLAVLPLRPINDENRDPIYELGIAESLILKLSSDKALTVRPLSAVRLYRQVDQSPTAAGSEQKVDYVLSSNYQVADGKIRVTSQLIDVRNGNVEGVFKTERDSANVFLMQDQIANDIGNLLLARLGNKQSDVLLQRGTENEEAYRLYLQAEYIFDQVNKEDTAKAIAYLENATQLDPNYAKAYAALAFAYRHMAKGTIRSEEQYLRSKTAVGHALELNPNLAEAHAVLGMIKASAEGDFPGAKAEFERAVALNPNSPAVRSMYSLHLASVGRFEESISEIKAAREMEPASRSHDVTHGMILYYAHRYDEATAHFRRIQENNKDLVYSYFWLWLLYDLQGNDAQAYEWFVKYETQIKAAPETLQIYRAAYDRSGWKGLLREHIAQDEKNLNADNASGLYYEMACFSARLGDKQKALDYLDKAYKERGTTITLANVDPYLDSLHGEPRFDKLLKKIGLT